MKKSILVAMATILMSGAAFAQTGKWYVGGNVGFNSNSTKLEVLNTKIKASSWSFAPEVGTFINDKTSVGLAFNIGGSKDDSNDLTTSSLTPTLYLRRFFATSDRFSLFTGLNLGFIADKNSSTDNGIKIETKQNGFGASVDLGGAYKLSDKFTVVGRYGALGFSSTTLKAGDTKIATDTNFGLNVNTLGSQFTVGFYYTLN